MCRILALEDTKHAPTECITFSRRAQRQTHFLNLTLGKQDRQGFPAQLGPEYLYKSMTGIRPKVQLTPYFVCRPGQQQMLKEDIRPAKSHSYVSPEQSPSLQSSAHITTTANHTLELIKVHFYSSLPTPLLLKGTSWTSQIIYLQNAFMATLLLTKASKLTLGTTRRHYKNPINGNERWEKEVCHLGHHFPFALRKEER